MRPPLSRKVKSFPYVVTYVKLMIDHKTCSLRLSDLEENAFTP